MLDKINKTVTVASTSVIGEKIVAGYNATINSEDPMDMNFSSWIQDNELYKENRVECRKDKADFEDYAYSIQDKMIEEKSVALSESVEEKAE